MSDSESEARRPNGVVPAGTPPLEPSTPPEVPSSQVTLPSTEAPPSPTVIEASQASLDENTAVAARVIPSSLTPPPSTQVHQPSVQQQPQQQQSLGPATQESTFVSPPATVNNNVVGVRDVSSEYTPPSLTQVREASSEQVRAMLATCIAEHQKLKMETAHHRLQLNLLSLQSSEEANRSEVELVMMRKEIDALRAAEHARSAKHQLLNFDEAMQTKYLDAKTDYEDALAEIDALSRRLKHAKRIIQQKDDEVVSLVDERARLLNRIRENREHMNKLRSPGGLFHGTSTSASTPRKSHHAHSHSTSAVPSHQPRALPDNESGHRLSTLIEALSQDNNSEPSTPVYHRPAPSSSSRHHLPAGKGHTRNAQSMSSLPTTPVSHPRGPHALLLPSADLVPHSEPPQRYHNASRPQQQAPRRGSRESTISAEGAGNNSSQESGSFRRHSQDAGLEQRDVYDSQASQAATEMLRRNRQPLPQQRGSLDVQGGRLLSSLREEKRGLDEDEGGPLKKSRVGSGTVEHGRLGLGIQYGR